MNNLQKLLSETRILHERATPGKAMAVCAIKEDAEFTSHATNTIEAYVAIIEVLKEAIEKASLEHTTELKDKGWNEQWIKIPTKIANVAREALLKAETIASELK